MPFDNDAPLPPAAPVITIILSSRETAELTIALIMAVMRGVARYDKEMGQKKWLSQAQQS
jgi:phosphoglycerate dehydrogenase-like enzyme